MPASLDEEWAYWDGKATELRRTQLGTVQAAATKWSALLTALLGVFGAVTFISGLTTIDKLDSTAANLARVLLTLAVLLDIYAVYKFAVAAGGLKPTFRNGISASTLRDMYTTDASRVLTPFNSGRKAAKWTIVSFLLGAGIVLWAPTGESPVSSAVFVIDGKAFCGDIEKVDGGTVTVNSQSGAVTSVSPVDKCP